MITKQQAQNKLSTLIPQDIRVLNDIFVKNDKQLFLVGGCVRDIFVDKIPKDFDVCTNALPNEILSMLNTANIKCELRGVDFGVVVAIMSEDIEIATFRSDLDSGTGSNKETNVTLGVTIEEDVKRRDLTINGLFFDLQKNEIIDLVGGIQDLEDKLIRTIGKPDDRFNEDNLRKLRAIVRGIKINFTFDFDTISSIKNNPKLNVSFERIHGELQKVDNDFGRLKLLLFETNLIFQILRDLNIATTNKIANISLDTMFANILRFEDLTIIRKSLTILKFSNDSIENICFLVKFMNADLSIVNPFTFFKEKQKTTFSDTDILFMLHSDKMFQLLDFKPIPTLSQTFMDQGITGKDLGIAINDFYFINRTNK